MQVLFAFRKYAYLLPLFILLPGCGAEYQRDSAGGYHIQATTVRWGNHEIANADSDALQVCKLDGKEMPWATDSKRVYFRNLVVNGADAKSFEVLTEAWAKDKDFVYYGIVDSAPVNVLTMKTSWPTEKGRRVDRFDTFDTSTLRIVHRESDHQVWFTDKNHVFRRNKIIEHADPKTFEFDPRSFLWKDDNYVYTAEMVRLCADVGGVTIYANGKTWHCLGKRGFPYSADDSTVWYNGFRLIPDADPKSFRALSYDYATDGAAVWFRGKPIKKVDAASFHLIKRKPFDKNGPVTK